jgi:hypothetical protein
MESERVTVDPNFCAGKFCIRSLYFAVSRLLGLLAAGETKEAILRAYPYRGPRISPRPYATRPISLRKKLWSLPGEVPD